jgi:cell wall-associated NlpC family hydrolase
VVGAGAAFALSFALITGFTLAASTGRAADSGSPDTGAIGGNLRPGSVPAAYAAWIEKAAGACPGLPAPVLAAQLHQESGFQPNEVSPAGAEGIAQFVPGTWNTWQVDADGDGVASPFEPADAITAQGRLMCSLLGKAQRSGYPDPAIEQSLAGYNAGWARVEQYQGVPPISFAGGQTFRYVRAIMAAAATYTAPAGPSGPVDLPAGFTLPESTPAAVRTAVGWALRQRGGWYHLGGSCTAALGSDPNRWCDCSSLVQQTYRAAGLTLPRTTQTQVRIGQAVSVDSPLPGDLVFSPGLDGTPAAPGHVALFIGDGLLIEAPHTGARIRLVTYASWRNATSPTNRVVAVRRIVPS